MDTNVKCKFSNWLMKISNTYKLIIIYSSQVLQTSFKRLKYSTPLKHNHFQQIKFDDLSFIMQSHMKKFLNSFEC